MAFSWIRNLGVAALIAAAGLAAKSLPGDATSIAWFPAGLAFALVALRREALLPGAAVGLFAAAMLQEHWLIAAATAVLSVAAGYVAGFVYAPLAQGKHGTLPSAITAIVLGLVLFALPIAFCQIGLKALVVPDEHVQADMAPRVMRDAGGMAISRDLTLGSSPTLQASAEQKQSPQTRTIVSLMLAVLLLLPAAWVGRGAGLTRKVRRGFARALVANTELPAREVVERSLGIAADICIYTNRNVVIDELATA